ncbi:hypothetical protein C9374_000882 [Naegleria lovaniensis]|uniref:Zn(2)-C6 fungal-type domain-containing protein n=1 Tax=Naegleria lovaniensis TaxID=51637 RepID=A0AA88KSH9_NAELO|nr:uncharacterized protein C9374_000882 [Naegleria lovaniensis]KAG2388032.1 hypothetical protein C9374_000882 [Naegleria lovaniensis]
MNPRNGQSHLGPNNVNPPPSHQQHLLRGNREHQELKENPNRIQQHTGLLDQGLNEFLHLEDFLVNEPSTQLTANASQMPPSSMLMHGLSNYPYSFDSEQHVLNSMIPTNMNQPTTPSSEHIHWNGNNNHGPLHQHLHHFINNFIVPTPTEIDMSWISQQLQLQSNTHGSNISSDTFSPLAQQQQTSPPPSSVTAQSTSSSSSSGESSNNNNVNNNITNNNNGNGVEYFPIACEQCRQQHRKCDKQLPKCYSCAQRGIECVYRESKRNKKSTNTNKNDKSYSKSSEKSRSVNNASKEQNRNQLSKEKSHSFNPLFSPYPLGKKPINEELQTSESLSSRAVIDFYFDVACDGYPLVSREELENFITLFPNCDDVDISSLQNCEMFAMYYSIRALCECRAGLFEQSEKTNQKAKDCLSKVFDRISSSSVAAVYAHLVVYELYIGKTEQAKFYFAILDFLTKKLFSLSENSSVDSITQSKLTIYEKNLEGWMYYYDTVLKLGLTEDFENHTVEDLLIRLPEMYSFFCQEPLPEEWVRLTKEKVSNENCFEIWSIVELLVNKFKHLEKSVILTIPDTVNRADFVEPIYQIVSDSLRIAILSKSQSPITRELIEKSALNITNHTENPLYPLFPVDILFCVRPAVEIHLEICNTLLQRGGNDFIHNGIDYFSILKKDLRAFALMKPKFKAVIKFINKVTDRVEKMIAVMEQLKYQ